MPDAHGELTYTEAVAAGLYGRPQDDAKADLGLVTYSPIGPGIAPHFGQANPQSQPGVPIRQAERS